MTKHKDFRFALTRFAEASFYVRVVLQWFFCLVAASAHAEQDVVFRSHDPDLGFFYEIRTDADFNRSVYVYKDRAGSIGAPVFQIQNNIFAAFHSPDGKFLVVDFGSAAYGVVSVVFAQTADGVRQIISEDEYRSLIAMALVKLYPNLKNGYPLHLYAEIRNIRNGEGLTYASGDFELEEGNRRRQEHFQGVFLGIDLQRKAVRVLTEKEAPKSWCRGLPLPGATYGSGFFVTQRNILTNAHVVGDENGVNVGLGNWEAWANVVAISDELDLALLELAPDSLAGVPIALASQKLVLGEKIKAFGFPLPEVQGYTLKETEGVVSGLFGLMDDPRNFQCTAPIQPGNSGGPLVDDQGHLLGVAVATLNKLTVAKVTGQIPENVNFGIHPDIVRRFLDDNHVSLSSEKDSQPFDPEKSCVQIINYDPNHLNVRHPATPAPSQMSSENAVAPSTQALAEAEIQLNEVYGKVRQRLDTTGKARLKASELQWLKERDKFKNNTALFLKATKDQILALQGLLSKLQSE